MKKNVFYGILFVAINLHVFGQYCTPEWTYDSDYQIETGRDGAFNELALQSADPSWGVYYFGPYVRAAQVRELPLPGSDKLAINLYRPSGTNSKEPFYKYTETKFFIASCATSFELEIRYQFRHYSEGRIFVNGTEVVDMGEDHNMGDPLTVLNIGHLLDHGLNTITVHFKDRGDRNDDDDTYFFLNAHIEANSTIFCAYDLDYRANVDSDGDGVKDEEEPQYGNFMCNAGESSDCDGDGIGDNADPDNDNDQVPDDVDIDACDPAQGYIIEGECCKTFQPKPGERYWISAWVKEDLTNRVKVKSYWRPVIEVDFLDAEAIINKVSFYPTGEIIDGWQRIVGELPIPAAADRLNINLINRSQNTAAGYADVFFDDIRIHPFNGSMKSFVYDPETLWLTAELDDNNYATFYEYDNEGQLIRIKKETARGIMTIQESRSKLTNGVNHQVVEPEGTAQ